MRKGLPSQYAKMGFKKGWAAYKRAGHGHSAKRGKRKYRSVMLGGMSGDFSTPTLVSKPLKKMSAITPGKIVSPIIDLGLIILGMVLAAGIKKASPIKNPHLMNGAQTVVGVGGSLLTKNRFVKMPLLGIALQSTIAEAKILFPKMVPLAGDDEVVYLPAGDETQMLEYSGEDGRVFGEDEYMAEAVGAEDDGRVAGVIDGEGEEGFGGEGNNN
jgi:hypothetical protein